MVEELLSKGPMDESPDLRMLFHRLNNQLGIILANAELLEAKTTDATNRARAAQLTAGAVDAMGTAREIRRIPTFPKLEGVRHPLTPEGHHKSTRRTRNSTTCCGKSLFHRCQTPI